MITAHEAMVASQFDAVSGRFKTGVADDDYRLEAIVASLSPVAERRVLDLGCGKGRFARRLIELGATVIGLDVSRAMLNEARGVDRVRGSARRLPFDAASFDAVMAVEVFEHMAHPALELACSEARRVLRPGGIFVIIDKNACSCNTQRPWLPGAVVKWIDQRRGRWMYRHDGQVRERWFRPGALKRRLQRWFAEVQVAYVLSRAEAGRFPFQWIPATRQMVLWSARVSGGAA
jgi:2-polyprenyl-6-hydroxyphenyl methylase/3-demethylubiquinone-9 3-methyltransferase